VAEAVRLGGVVKPYYEEAGIVIYHGDSRAIAPQLSYDAVVSDPPYGMSEDTNRSRFSGGGQAVAPARDWGEPVAGDAQAFDPSAWLDRKHVILWGANHFAAALPVGSTLVWIKKPDHLFGTFLSDCEIGWRSGGHGVYAFRFYWNGFSRLKLPSASFVHPCQKPDSLMAWCIQMVPPDALICDPFMGSGTTLVAAKNLGRKAIGIEIEERYCEIAAERLRQGVLLT
jgi:DNA modification methylase